MVSIEMKMFSYIINADKNFRDQLNNIDMMLVEVPTCPRAVINSWNIKTAQWLNKCTIFFKKTNGNLYLIWRV